MEKLAIRNQKNLAIKTRPTVYDRACVRACIYIYACTCIRVSLRLFTRKMQTQFFTCVCVSLRACLHTALIKTQNAFVCKIFQHSNALWVQKLSGRIIHVHVCASSFSSTVFGCCGKSFFDPKVIIWTSARSIPTRLCSVIINVTIQ